MLITWGEPDPARLEEHLAACEHRGLSYPEVAGTAAGSMPVGYRHDELRTVLGAGDEVYQRGCAGLWTWRAHLGAGLTVFPPGAAVTLDTTVLVLAPLGPLRVVAPCRIVAVVDEPDRAGFAYGTLPGHPETGEEAFVCERAADGSVGFRIRAFSRPGNRLTKLAGPLARSRQLRTTAAYLDALRAYAGADG